MSKFIHFASEESEGSDLSYDTSFDEKDGQLTSPNPQMKINLFKESMQRFLLTNSEFQNNILQPANGQIEEYGATSLVPVPINTVGQSREQQIPHGQTRNHDHTHGHGSSAQPYNGGIQSQKGGGIGVFAQGIGQKVYQGMQRVSSSQLLQNSAHTGIGITSGSEGSSKNTDAHRNLLWGSIASNLMQESKRMGQMPSIENFTQRLNLFRKKVEKPDVIEMILENQEMLLKQILKEEESKDKIQNRIRETIQVKLRKEQGDVKYYSNLKKNQFDSRMQQEEARVRKTHHSTIAGTSTGATLAVVSTGSIEREKRQGVLKQPLKAVQNGVILNKQNQSPSKNVVKPQQKSEQHQQQQFLSSPSTGVGKQEAAGVNTGGSSSYIQLGSLRNIETAVGGSLSSRVARQSTISIPNLANPISGVGQQQQQQQSQVFGERVNYKSLRFQTPPVSGQTSPKNRKQEFFDQQQQQMSLEKQTENKKRKNRHLHDVESRILSSSNPIIKNNFALSARTVAKRETSFKQFKARPVPGIFERLSQDLMKKNSQQVEPESDEHLEIDFKTSKAEQLYREIRKKGEDEEEAKRYLIDYLVDHRKKVEEEFKTKPSLLSQGQKYYSEESKEFQLLSPNFLAKKRMAELMSSGMLHQEFYEHRANLEEGNVYLLTKVSKILKGNLLRKWKSIQDSQY